MGTSILCSNGLLLTCLIPTLLQDVDCYSSKIILCEWEYCDLCPHDGIVYDAVIMWCAGTDHHLRVCHGPRSWHSRADYNTQTPWPPRIEYQVSTCDFHVILMWFTCMACDLHGSLWLHVSYICVMLAFYHVLQMCCMDFNDWIMWLACDLSHLGLALYPGLRLLAPVFIACSTNVGEGLVKLSHVVWRTWTCGGVAHSFCTAVKWLSESKKHR